MRARTVSRKHRGALVSALGSGGRPFEGGLDPTHLGMFAAGGAERLKVLNDLTTHRWSLTRSWEREAAVFDRGLSHPSGEQERVREVQSAGPIVWIDADAVGRGVET